LLIQFGFVAYVGFIARYGAKEIAAYFIGVRILALSFLPGFGFSAASATLVGQGLGAGDPKFSRRAGWESTGMAIVGMTLMGVLFIVFAHQIAALFIDDSQPNVSGARVAGLAGHHSTCADDLMEALRERGLLD